MTSQRPETHPSTEKRGSSTPASSALTITIAGGKGGVGKTTVALNTAMVLAQEGYRTLLLDGDLELANVNVMLGLYPTATLEHAVAGHIGLKDVLIPVAENLDLLPGASGVQDCLARAKDDQQRFLDELALLESGYDRVIIDTAAGLRTSALHMIAAAHLSVVVITPDPTSLTDAFSLLRLLHRRGYRRELGIVVNMARDADHARSVHRRFATAVSRYIGLTCHFLAFLRRDEGIARSVARQRPVTDGPASDPSARAFHALTGGLTDHLSRAGARSLGFAAYWSRLIQRKSGSAPKTPATAAPSGADSSIPRPPQEAPAPVPAAASARVEDLPRESGWPAHFRSWLRDAEADPVARYETLNNWLATLGERLDEDMIETLQTGLANMNWEGLPDAQRRTAAQHFRQLADLVAPPVRPRASDGHRYAVELFGSQEALLSQLRAQPDSASLNGLLEQLRGATLSVK